MTLWPRIRKHTKWNTKSKYRTLDLCFYRSRSVLIRSCSALHDSPDRAPKQISLVFDSGINIFFSSSCVADVPWPEGDVDAIKCLQLPLIIAIIIYYGEWGRVGQWYDSRNRNFQLLDLYFLVHIKICNNKERYEKMKIIKYNISKNNGTYIFSWWYLQPWKREFSQTKRLHKIIF